VAKLDLLAVEWRNVLAEDFMHEERMISMQTLHKTLLKLKDEKTYTENWIELINGKLDRHAHSDEYVASLLYLVDERPVPISTLQKSIHLQLGHLFRTLDRAGVEFRAHTSALGSRLRQGYWPWPCEIFVDPVRNVILRNGEEIPIPSLLKIYHRDEGPQDDPEDSDPTEDDYIGLMEEEGDVPLPIHSLFRKPALPPDYQGVLTKLRENYNVESEGEEEGTTLE
jgi:hypothetical protein